MAQTEKSPAGNHYGKLTDRLFSIRTLGILAILSIIVYPLAYPSWYSGILPFLCMVLPIGYTFHPRVREHLYRRVAVSFIFAVSFLLIFLLISANIASNRSEDILRIAISLLIGAMGLVIIVDLFLSFKNVDTKWILRLIPAVVFEIIGTFLLMGRNSFNIPLSNTTVAGDTVLYIMFSAIMISGILLSIYAWLDLDRKDMNWFYLYCSFLSVAALPVIVLVLSRYIAQPILLSFSCHASSTVRVRRKGSLGRRMERYRRRKHLVRLHENGEVSDFFRKGMEGLISEASPRARRSTIHEKKDILHETHTRRGH